MGLLERTEVGPGFLSKRSQKQLSSGCARGNAEKVQRAGKSPDRWFSEGSVKGFPWNIIHLGQDQEVMERGFYEVLEDGYSLTQNQMTPW